MSVLVILIPVSITLGLLGLAAFVWTVKRDQYDDLEGNASRILIDEEKLDKRGGDDAAPISDDQRDQTTGAASRD